eukprot:gene9502-11258_t
MGRFGSVSPSEVIDKVAADDPSLTVVDLANNPSFQNNPKEYTKKLCEALSGNTLVTEVNLGHCEIADESVPDIAAMLNKNTSVVTLNLEGNKLKSEGAGELARGLAHNKSLTALSLLNQTTIKAFGDGCLQEFMDAFDTNITLLKITWRLDSRKSFALNKLITRNNEILRRVNSGRSYDELLPSALKGSTIEPSATTPEEAPRDSLDEESTKEKPEAAAEDPGTPVSGTQPPNSSGRSRTSSIGEALSNVGRRLSKMFTGPPTDVESSSDSPPGDDKETQDDADSHATGDQAPAQAPAPEVKRRRSSFAGQVVSGVGAVVAAPVKTVGKLTSRFSGGAENKRTLSVSVKDSVALLTNNDPNTTTLDLSNSAVFQMKSQEFCDQIGEALATNTTITDLNLSKNEISDMGVSSIVKGLTVNKSLITLNLEGNRIRSEGAEEISKGLAQNTTLRSISLFNQTNTKAFGDATLQAFIDMFETNVTLLKITWRLDSRKSFALNKLITRNNEIDRRLKAGRDYLDILPEKLKENPPTLTPSS